MKDLGYLVVAYALTGAAIGAYLLSLARRRRSLVRRLERTGGGAPDRAGQGVSRG